MADKLPRVEDLVPVRSRVSWAAIWAGAAMALALYFVLALLGTAVGFAVRNNVQTDTLMTVGGIWALFGAIVALFVGGFITTQMAVGENKMEAAVHGVLTWGVVFALLLGMASLGIRSGFNALLGIATLDEMRSGSVIRPEPVTGVERPASLTEGDTAALEARAQMTSAAAWWALAGTILSLSAAVAGGLVGSGPSWRLLAIQTQSRILVDGRDPVLARQ